MTKYKYNSISKMRSFEESPAKWFMVGGVKMSRKDVERMQYMELKHMIRRGRVLSIQVVK